MEGVQIVAHAGYGTLKRTGETVTEELCQVVMKEPVPPRQLNPQIPPGLEAICLKCLAKNPDCRYPSAAALAGALRPGSPASPAGPDWPVLDRNGRMPCPAAVPCATQYRPG